MTTPPRALALDQIKEVIPQRWPMLFLDRVLSGNTEELLASYRFSHDEWFFARDFPGRPVVPSVILLEALAQASGILYWYNYGSKGLLVLARDETRFVRPVYSGDEVRIHVKKIKLFPAMGTVQGEVFVRDRLVAQSLITCALASGRDAVHHWAK